MESKEVIPKTTVIISNLKKEDFTSKEASGVSAGPISLSLTDSLKLTILNLPTPPGIEYKGQNGYFLEKMDSWTNLSFSNRTVVIMKDETSAEKLYNYLKNSDILPSRCKVSLKENLLSRSKSFESLDVQSRLVTATELQKFKQHFEELGIDKIIGYKEPEPQHFDESKFEDTVQDDSSLKPQSTVGSEESSTRESSISRSASQTRTLFKPKPSLKVNTTGHTDVHEKGLSSPTITLDETF